MTKQLKALLFLGIFCFFQAESLSAAGQCTHPNFANISAVLQKGQIQVMNDNPLSKLWNSFFTQIRMDDLDWNVGWDSHKYLRENGNAQSIKSRAQSFLGRLGFNQRTGDGGVRPKKDLLAMRNEFKQSLSAAVSKGEVTIEQLIQFAQLRYNKNYYDAVYISGPWAGFRTLDKEARENANFVFATHEDVMALVPVALKYISDHRENYSAEDLVKLAASLRSIGRAQIQLPIYPSWQSTFEIPPWVKISNKNEVIERAVSQIEELAAFPSQDPN